MAKKKGKQKRQPDKAPTVPMGDILPHEAVPQPGHPSTRISANDATSIPDPSNPDNLRQVQIGD